MFDSLQRQPRRAEVQEQKLHIVEILAIREYSERQLAQAS